MKGEAKPGTSEVLLKLDASEVHTLLRPIVKEVNELRARVAQLEEFIGASDPADDAAIMNEINPTGQW